MDITVAIPTWNRAASLERALESLAGATVPGGIGWEIVVVDNGSTDRTADVVTSFAGRLPVRRVVERDQGVAPARNRALAEARGALMLWIDDDVTVDPNWFVSYWLAAFHDARKGAPEFSLFTGPMVAKLDGTVPAWVQEGWPWLAGLYGSFNAASADGAELAAPPFGANFAVRTDAIRNYSFRSDIGRKRGERLTGEETLLFRAMMDDGHRVCWVPGAHVHHHIAEHQLTRSYVRRSAAGMSATADLLESDGVDAPWESEEAMGLAQQLIAALAFEGRYLLGRAVGDTNLWLPDMKRAAGHWGRVSARLRVKAPWAPPLPKALGVPDYGTGVWSRLDKLRQRG